MNLLVIDTETTGVDPKTCEVTEIAAAVYNGELRTPIWAASTFVPTTIPGGLEPHSGISQAMCDSVVGAFAPLRTKTLIGIALAAGGCDAIVAHNASFDQPFVEKLFADEPRETLSKTPWVCSINDLVHAEQVKGKRLGHIAVDLGLPVTGWHRAANDVSLLCEILGRVPDLKLQIEIALKPRAEFKAMVSFEKKDLAKDRGFRWNPDKKIWTKRMPLDTPLEATLERPFRVVKL